MPITSSLVASVALASAATAQLLAPVNDINLPASESAEQPLQWLGGNSPYFAGNVLVLESLQSSELYANDEC